MATLARPEAVAAAASGRLIERFMPRSDVTERHETLVHAPAQPWKGDVAFTPVTPDRFATYSEPDRVKIVWTLEAEPLAPALTRFRTETRVLATDEAARTRFRRYWRWAGVGIVLIRLLLLPALRREAERRARP